jgi:hypothetical protein
MSRIDLKLAMKTFRPVWLCTAVVICASQAPLIYAEQPHLDQVLARAAQYVVAYEQRFSLLVAEEFYEQEIQRPAATGGNLSRNNPGGGFIGSGVSGRRVLRSDYLLVRVGQDGGGWIPFRDVFEENGRSVRDRQERLLELFVNPTGTAFEQAAEIMRESARRNLGNVDRTINIPTLALLFVHPEISSRFQFNRESTQTVDGTTYWVVAYRETSRPTLIKTTRGQDMPLSGRLHINPANGEIAQTGLVAADRHVRATVEVTFTMQQDLDMWVPAIMEESYQVTGATDLIMGRAKYGNYRQFQVSTGERIRRPPGGHY